MNNKKFEESEKWLEAELTRRVKEGGCLSLKFASNTQTGYPDRLVISPMGEHYWVELKSKGKKPRKLQEVRIAELRSMRQTVFVVSTPEELHRAVCFILNREAELLEIQREGWED